MDLQTSQSWCNFMDRLNIRLTQAYRTDHGMYINVKPKK
uniref:Uncharacterized protein n=1 Tax=Anguilla anguilla TaxID=7936 RepID=A0A0E9QWH7_ANGAN